MSFPKRIDNSIRTAFVTCPTQARRAYIEHLAPVQPSVHLHAGGAFAAGLEATRRAFYEGGKPAAEAIDAGRAVVLREYGDFEPPERSYKTAATMAEALSYYFEDAWPLGTDTYRPQRMEWRFEVPIPGLTHPDDQGPIMYVGRPDTIGDSGGLLMVEDDKTASSLGPSWAKQWELDSQPTGYWWAGQQLGILPVGGPGPVLFRGVSILKPKMAEVEDADGPIVKAVRGKEKRFREEYVRRESFGHMQALVYRPQWMIERWLVQLQRDVRRMIYAYLNDQWDYALHKGACAAYGGCTFAELCASESPERWVEVNFVKRAWDPLAAT